MWSPYLSREQNFQNFPLESFYWHSGFWGVANVANEKPAFNSSIVFYLKIFCNFCIPIIYPALPAMMSQVCSMSLWTTGLPSHTRFDKTPLWLFCLGPDYWFGPESLERTYLSYLFHYDQRKQLLSLFSFSFFFFFFGVLTVKNSLTVKIKIGKF